MDLYLPDEFYALRESPNPPRAKKVRDDREWLGGEAFVGPLTSQTAPHTRSEPDPIWRVI